MALYTIGEVALLCDINPVTLRAWQRRYGLLKPQRTDGGHRLFGNLHSLRTWIKERGQDYPAQTLTTHLFIPLRRRLQCQQPTLQALLAILDGVLINYIAICLASARKKQGKDALVVGWNIQDTTRLWLEGWIASQQGWRIDVLAHSLNQLRPELFEGRTLLVWCGENRTSAQQQQLTSWQEQGHDIFPLGI
ncbi:MAG: MerR family DNA-binding transcriptional regulator [Escherichia coli]|nr:MerR family DNA-binding transcriptional regulator [Escherichia coli]